MSSPHVSILVMDQTRATSLWEKDHLTQFVSTASHLNAAHFTKDKRFADRFEYSGSTYSYKKGLVLWIESAWHRRTKAFPTSGSNDQPLSNHQFPGPHRCADRVSVNLPSHVLLPIILLLRRTLQPAALFKHLAAACFSSSYLAL